MHNGLYGEQKQTSWVASKSKRLERRRTGSSGAAAAGGVMGDGGIVSSAERGAPAGEGLVGEGKRDVRHMDQATMGEGADN
jgi:hypothetical protein